MMCNQCNYVELLESSNLKINENRLRVLEVVGDNRYPLSAAQIFKTLEPVCAINRVTVYRILERLVYHGIIERLSTGGRAFYYGLAPNEYHRPHPHFYCKRCGQMDCLDPDSLDVDADSFWEAFPGRIDKVEVRFDGICKSCLR